MTKGVRGLVGGLEQIDIFPWSANFEVGIAEVDQQHKQLVALLNKLTNTLVYDDELELAQVFDELAAYAQFHFATEEAIWERTFADDPWLEKHQATHTSFLPTVRKLMSQQGDKPLREVSEEIIKFLIHWLAYHIIDSDKRMALALHKVESGMVLAEAKQLSEREMVDSAKVLMATIFHMYDALSSRTLALMRERVERQRTEEQLSQANRELEQLSITDQLTGLYNRRYFNDIFERELRRAQRDRHYLTLIMFDIDYFKRLNDHYGHVQGDIALEQVGRRLQQICHRPGDFVFRLGGEEFAVLVAEQDSSTGPAFGETIRAEIERLRIPHQASEVGEHLTISVGVVSRAPDTQDSLERYMRDVDARLYLAKSQGRNRVIHAD